MVKALQFFFPHHKNNYRPYLLRHQFLSLFVVSVIALQSLINVYYYKTPQVLGFATSISAQEIISLTNSERTSHGVGEVQENSLLNQAAQLKAQDMFDYDYWAHTNPYDPNKDPWYWFDEVGYVYYMAGENLAMNFDTSAGVVNGWMASPSHRDNLLNGNFENIGVAVVNGVLQGEETTLVVQLFGTLQSQSPPPTQSANPAPTANPTPVPTLAPLPTVTPTPSPTPTPTPTPEGQVVTAVVRTPSGDKPISSGGALFGGELRWRAVQENINNPAGMGMGRIVMLSSLIILLIVFLVDSLVVVHREHFHISRSHGFLQVGILGILVIAILVNSVGMVL